MNIRSVILFVPAVLLPIAGCSTLPYRSNPSLPSRSATIASITFLPAKVEVYELSTGGNREKIDEWCVQGLNNVSRAVCSTLEKTNGVTLHLLPVDSVAMDTASLLYETETLFDAVNESILDHTYGDGRERFGDKIDAFDYSLGVGLDRIDTTADAYLLVRGIDHISSSGRRAAQAGAAIVGALFGVSMVPSGGITAISVALVDAKDGSILWHSFIAEGGSYDLRDEASAAKIVKRALKKFPVRTAQAEVKK